MTQGCPLDVRIMTDWFDTDVCRMSVLVHWLSTRGLYYIPMTTLNIRWTSYIERIRMSERTWISIVCSTRVSSLIYTDSQNFAN